MRDALIVNLVAAIRYGRRPRPADAKSISLSLCRRNELVEAAESGLCDANLHSSLTDIGWTFKITKRDIEGMNSILKWMDKILPNLSRTLRSSRVTVKKALTHVDLASFRERRQANLASAVAKVI